MSDAEVVHSRAMSRSGLRLGDLGQTHHCLGPNNRQRNRPAVGGTQRRAMRVRAARPRRNVQQCDQELLHSAAPAWRTRTESFVILLFVRESRRTTSEVIGDRFTGDVGVFCCFCFLSLFVLGLNDSSFAWSERRSGYSQGIRVRIATRESITHHIAERGARGVLRAI